jgi:hypothetical protein
MEWEMAKHAVAKAVLVCLIYAAATYMTRGQEPSRTPGCCSIVEGALEAVGRIKTGEQRSVLEKEFVHDGGIYSRSETTYIYRACPYIKIRVTFALDPAYKDFVTGSPIDTVKSVSKPFVEYPARD